MHNVITQSGKVNQTLPTFQGYGPTKYKKCKIDIAIPMELAQARCRKVKGDSWMGTLIYALEKRLKERERENRFREARPHNLLIIALCGLASFCFHPCPFCLHLGSRTLAPSILAPCVYMQRQKSRQAKKQIKEKHAKDKLGKDAKHGQTNMLSNKRGVSQEDKCSFGSSVHSSIGLEYGRHTDLCMNM